ncbi:hypothetical protein [Clostridium sp. OS1-26]|uniref:hypothetical protein n=1 Tax=Clostridium sp. OS1-26 TaxID=3070681 RepID=UPI0027DFC520|nr:hypothetical protein [Clostridium sp. OS1-26]WML36965.1 hypothetical protein RCG18_10300 [Clostridium sp. OS1-26]
MLGVFYLCKKVSNIPIPNRLVKLDSADGTAGETLWKSRSSPGNMKDTKQMLGVFLFMQIIE